MKTTDQHYENQTNENSFKADRLSLLWCHTPAVQTLSRKEDGKLEASLDLTENQKESDTIKMGILYREETLSITFICKNTLSQPLSCDRQKGQNKNVQVTTV